MAGTYILDSSSKYEISNIDKKKSTKKTDDKHPGLIEKMLDFHDKYENSLIYKTKKQSSRVKKFSQIFSTRYEKRHKKIGKDIDKAAKSKFFIGDRKKAKTFQEMKFERAEKAASQGSSKFIKVNNWLDDKFEVLDNKKANIKKAIINTAKDKSNKIIGFASDKLKKIKISSPGVDKVTGFLNRAGNKAGNFLKNSKAVNRFGKIAGKAGEKIKKIGIIDFAVTAGKIATSKDKGKAIAQEVGSAVGGKAGGKIGAGIGASIGTAIFPGVGTAVGAVVGNFIGSSLGSKAGKKIAGFAVDLVRNPKKTFNKLGKKVKKTFKSIKNKLSSFGDKIFGTKDKISKSIGKVTKDSGLGKKFSNAFGSLSKRIKKGFKKTPAYIGTKVVHHFAKKAKKGIKNFIKNRLSRNVKKVKKVKKIARPFTPVLTLFSKVNKLRRRVASVYHKKKKTPWYSRIGNWWSKRRNAEGSIVNNRALTWVGEEGPEAIIPLNSTRRQRGADLWKRTGRLLGMDTEPKKSFTGRNMQLISGDNSTPGKSNAGEGGAKNIQVNVGGVTIQVKAGGEGGSLLDMIETQKEEIANAISGIIAEALEDGFENIPLSVA